MALHKVEVTSITVTGLNAVDLAANGVRQILPAAVPRDGLRVREPARRGRQLEERLRLVPGPEGAAREERQRLRAAGVRGRGRAAAHRHGAVAVPAPARDDRSRRRTTSSAACTYGVAGEQGSAGGFEARAGGRAQEQVGRAYYYCVSPLPTGLIGGRSGFMFRQESVNNLGGVPWCNNSGASDLAFSIAPAYRKKRRRSRPISWRAAAGRRARSWSSTQTMAMAERCESSLRRKRQNTMASGIPPPIRRLASSSPGLPETHRTTRDSEAMDARGHRLRGPPKHRRRAPRTRRRRSTCSAGCGGGSSLQGFCTGDAQVLVGISFAVQGRGHPVRRIDMCGCDAAARRRFPGREVVRVHSLSPTTAQFL
jgi:hypothetical protein